MDNLIFIILLLGSYSIGYGLVKAGFPQIQKRNFIEKMAYGYIGGLIIFGTPFLITSAFKLLDIYYFLVCLIVYFSLTLILILKKILLNETEEPLKEEQTENSNYYNSNKDSQQMFNQPNLIKNENEEKNRVLTNSQMNPNNIIFNEGLMVKTRRKEEQVFKEENKDNISQLKKENKEFGENENNEQKNSMLEKLRAYAQEINNSKKEKEIKKNRTQEEEEDLESEEELLNMFNDE
jgi:hypothetical protein